MIKVGDTVQRTQGTYADMVKGDSSVVTGIYTSEFTRLIHCMLKDYHGQHSIRCLEVLK